MVYRTVTPPLAVPSLSQAEGLPPCLSFQLCFQPSHSRIIKHSELEGKHQDHQSKQYPVPTPGRLGHQPPHLFSGLLTTSTCFLQLNPWWLQRQWWASGQALQSPLSYNLRVKILALWLTDHSRFLQILKISRPRPSLGIFVHTQEESVWGLRLICMPYIAL